jgi:hypothetical protein
MRRAIIVLAAVTVLAGCASGASRQGYTSEGDASSASPILTSQSDCVRDGGAWNAKLSVCEPRRTR